MKAALSWLIMMLAAATAGHVGGASMEARQVVIRAPELDMVEASTAADRTETKIIAMLWQAVREGRARVLSDITSAGEPGQGLEVRQGRQAWLPTELSQNMNRLFLTPTSYEQYFVGTSLHCEPSEDASFLAWKGVCIPRGPVVTRWPTSWLEIWVNHKPDPNHRLIRGWLDFHDLFEESMTGRPQLGGGHMRILATMAPADQVWPAEREGRWLDVFLGQAKPQAAGKAADSTPAPAPNARAPAIPQTTLYGIGLGATEAVALMENRRLGDDAELLRTLVARVRAGTARMHLCVGSGFDLQIRCELKSARLHQFPTEMPSIPSAWGMQPVGTTLQMDDTGVALHQDLAPPGRSEWRLALDDPQAVMWEPRFRALEVRTQPPVSQGTHLLSLLHIPEVIKGEGIPADETLLIFAQHEAPPVVTDGHASAVGQEAEVIVFELPGTGVGDFQGLPGDPPPDEDGERFAQLLKRVKADEVRVAAHGVVVCSRGVRAVAQITEEVMTATEFDPPHEKGVPRMRPTALETLSVGSALEIEVVELNNTNVEFSVNVNFSHSTALPMEPSLEASLALAANDSAEYPPATHLQETWKSPEDLRLRHGQIYCLGVRKPPGIDRKVIHAAYLRVRRLP